MVQLYGKYEKQYSEGSIWKMKFIYKDLMAAWKLLKSRDLN